VQITPESETGVIEGPSYSTEVHANQIVTADLPYTFGPDRRVELELTVYDDSQPCNSDMSVCSRGYGMYKVSYGDVAWDSVVSPLSVKGEATFSITLDPSGSASVAQSRSVDTIDSLASVASPRPILDLETRPNEGPFIEATLTFDSASAGNIGWDLRQLYDDGSLDTVLYEHPIGTFSHTAFQFEAITMYMPIPVAEEGSEEPRHFQISVQDVSNEPHCCWDFSWKLFDENEEQVFESEITDQGEAAPTEFTESFYLASDGFLTTIDSTPNIFEPIA